MLRWQFLLEGERLDGEVGDCEGDDGDGGRLRLPPRRMGIRFVPVNLVCVVKRCAEDVDRAISTLNYPSTIYSTPTLTYVTTLPVQQLFFLNLTLIQ